MELNDSTDSKPSDRELRSTVSPPAFLPEQAPLPQRKGPSAELPEMLRFLCCIPRREVPFLPTGTGSGKLLDISQGHKGKHGISCLIYTHTVQDMWPVHSFLNPSGPPGN